MSNALAHDEALARRAAALAERASAARATSWRPQVKGNGHPNPLAGVLVRLEHATTSYGRCGVIVLRAPDGQEWRVWCLHAVLKDELRAAAPRVGELVAIRYEGRVEPTNGGSAYERFCVLVDREEAAPDWDQLAGEPGLPEHGAEPERAAGPGDAIPY
jgi:hypothetical protein